MRRTHWVLALGLALAPGFVLEAIGCVAAKAAGPPLASGAVSLRTQTQGRPLELAVDPTDEDESPGDPCAEPDMLDGLDDPCYVDVPPEEVRRVLSGGGHRP